MKVYQSHKKVKATQIIEAEHYWAERSPNGRRGITITRDDGMVEELRDAMIARYIPVVGDYLVEYEDGYRSISPKKAFEEGYSLAEGQ